MRGAALGCGVLGVVVATCIGGCIGKVPGVAGAIDAAPTADAAPDAVPDAPPGTVQITIANHPTDAMTYGFVVAYQDGSAAWTLAPAPVGDVYTIPNVSGRYGVAWTCLAGGLVIVDATYETVADHTALTISSVPAACTDRTVTITGTVANVSAATTVAYTAAAGNANVDVVAGAYTLTVPPGTYDVVIAEAPTTAPLAPDKLAIVRAVNASANVTANVDFATAVAPLSQAATIALGANQTGISATRFYGSQTAALLGGVSTAPFNTISLSVGQSLATDLYDQVLSVTDSTTASTAEMALTSAAPAAIAYTAPTAIGAITATAKTAAPVTIEATWLAYANAVGFAIDMKQTRAAPCAAGAIVCQVDWAALVSADYLAAALTYTSPDLTGLAGWNPSLDLATGITTTVMVNAETSSLGAKDFPFGSAKAGTTRTAAFTAATVTP